MYPFAVLFSVQSILILFSTLLYAEECSIVIKDYPVTDWNASLFENCTNVVVELPPGNHSIKSQISFPTTLDTVQLVAKEGNVTVSCDYTPTHDYTWLFKDLSSLTLTGIDFNDCPRPIRIDTISNVTINNCSFK